MQVLATLFPADSKLRDLNPVIDGHGVMQVDGHLRRAEFLSDDQRSSNNQVTQLLIQDVHEKGNHVMESTILWQSYQVDTGF